MRPEVTCEMLFTFEVFAGDVFFFGATFFFCTFFLAGAVFVVGLVGTTITDWAEAFNPKTTTAITTQKTMWIFFNVFVILIFIFRPATRVSFKFSNINLRQGEPRTRCSDRRRSNARGSHCSTGRKRC